jgi:hypothetical protein
MNTDKHGCISRNSAGARAGDAKAQRFDTNCANYRQFKCAKGATEISPGLERSDYPGYSSHKIIPSPIGWEKVAESRMRVV